MRGMANTAMSAGNEPGWWRTVLGEYPTGVAIVTSLAEDGQPVGMVVGSFSAVSQDPPMIGFMPANNSSTFPEIARHGRLVVNVLGANHEALCRAFAQRQPDRFGEGRWVKTAGGLPRLSDALAWFEAGVVAQHPAGDHTIVVAAVDDFGVGGTNAGLPLLYLRGGYGSFTVPSLSFDVQGFTSQLRLVEAIRDAVITFAEDLNVECVTCGLAGDSVVVLNAMNLRGGFDRSTRPVGSSFLFAAPMAPTFAAWASDEVQTTWLENARHLFGGIDRPVLQALLERTRSRGFGVWRGATLAEEFDHVRAAHADGRSEPAALWAAVAKTLDEPDGSPLPDDATAAQVPVFGPDGNVQMVVVVSKFEGAVSRHGTEELHRRLLLLRDDLATIAARESAPDRAGR